MMNLLKTISIVLTALLLVVTGCSSEESKPEQTQEVARPTPKPRPKPVVKTPEQLKNEMNIDARIFMDENTAPRSEDAKKAVLTFFDAFLNADEVALKGMLSFNEQLEVDAMIADGLADVMDQVTYLQLLTGTSPESKETVLAIYEVGLDYQVQVWHYDSINGSFTFSAGETPPNLVSQLSGDWLESYFALKDKQTEIANQQDAESSYILAGEVSADSGAPDRGNEGPSNPSGPSRPVRPRSPGF